MKITFLTTFPIKNLELNTKCQRKANLFISWPNSMNIPPANVISIYGALYVIRGRESFSSSVCCLIFLLLPFLLVFIENSSTRWWRSNIAQTLRNIPSKYFIQSLFRLLVVANFFLLFIALRRIQTQTSLFKSTWSFPHFMLNNERKKKLHRR